MEPLQQLRVTKKTEEKFRAHFMIEENKEIDLCMMTYPNGDVYVGEYQNKNMHGFGTMYYIGGDVQMSRWKDNVAHEFGAYKSKSGINLVGQWKNGLLNGKRCEIQYPCGSLYVGEMTDNMMTGEGAMFYANGDMYYGEWVMGNWHGKGTIKYPNGEIYTGEFVHNERRGKGRCVWPSGLIYDGEWADDTLNGEGILDAREYDNRIHTGPWVNGVQQQNGITNNFL